jgi:hypothetical protein
MNLALVIASLVAVVGSAPSVRTYAPYVLRQEGLQPEEYVLLIPVLEETLQEVEDIEIPSPNEESIHLDAPGILVVRYFTCFFYSGPK